MGRLQTRLALGELLARTRRIELAGPPVLAPFPVHGPMHLPLALHPALPSSTAGDL